MPVQDSHLGVTPGSTVGGGSETEGKGFCPSGGADTQRLPLWASGTALGASAELTSGMKSVPGMQNTCLGHPSPGRIYTPASISHRLRAAPWGT